MTTIEEGGGEKCSDQGGSSQGSGSGSGAGSSSQAWSDNFSTNVFKNGFGVLQRLTFSINDTNVTKKIVPLGLLLIEFIQWLTLPLEVTISKATGLSSVGTWIALIRAPELGDDANGVVIWVTMGILILVLLLMIFEWTFLQRGGYKPHERILWLLKWFSVLLPVLFFPALGIGFSGLSLVTCLFFFSFFFWFF